MGLLSTIMGSGVLEGVTVSVAKTAGKQSENGSLSRTEKAVKTASREKSWSPKSARGKKAGARNQGGQRGAKRDFGSVARGVRGECEGSARECRGSASEGCRRRWAP